MKRLNELKKSELATILKIDGSQDFRKRLFSFGLTKGSQILVKECSIGKQNIEIEVSGTLVALRSEEAKLIEVDINE
jgi:ferrous iron transport protein A